MLSNKMILCQNCNEHVCVAHRPTLNCSRKHKRSLNSATVVFFYLHITEGVKCDTQAVENDQYILSTPDFAGTLKPSFRQQHLALLNPAELTTENSE